MRAHVSALGVQERRRRDVRRAGDPLDDECDLVDVAPVPVLTRLERADDRVRRGVRMCAGVAVGRVVAAADVPAGQADPEMEPLAAHSQAILATVDGGGQLVDGDLVEMGADGVAHVTPSRAGVRERWAWIICTAIDPSPTAVAQRFVDPDRTSPAANTPGTSVASR